MRHGCRGAQALGTEEVAPQWRDLPETSPLFRVWLITPVAWPSLLTQLWLLELLARSGKGALGNSIPPNKGITDSSGWAGPRILGGPGWGCTGQPGKTKTNTTLFCVRVVSIVLSFFV